MRDAARELSHRFHFLRVAELGFGRPLLGDVPRDGVDVPGDRIRRGPPGEDALRAVPAPVAVLEVRDRVAAQERIEGLPRARAVVGMNEIEERGLDELGEAVAERLAEGRVDSLQATLGRHDDEHVEREREEAIAVGMLATVLGHVGGDGHQPDHLALVADRTHPDHPDEHPVLVAVHGLEARAEPGPQHLLVEVSREILVAGWHQVQNAVADHALARQARGRPVDVADDELAIDHPDDVERAAGDVVERGEPLAVQPPVQHVAVARSAHDSIMAPQKRDIHGARAEATPQLERVSTSTNASSIGPKTLDYCAPAGGRAKRDLEGAHRKMQGQSATQDARSRPLGRIFANSARRLAVGVLLVVASLLADRRGHADTKPFVVGPEPSRIATVAPADESKEPSQQVANGLWYLLYDHQVRVEDRAQDTYSRWVQKITNESGLNAASQVDISFDPSFETLTIHSVVVRRGSEVFDRLDRGAIRLVQREQNLDAQVYDGRVSAVLFLRDLRVGDVIDYAYTLGGSDPTLRGRYADAVVLGAPETIAHLYSRLLLPQTTPLRFARRGPPPSVGSSDPAVRIVGGLAQG